MTPNQKLLTWGIGSIIGIFVLVLVSPFVIINAGHRGVVVKLGEVQDNVLGEGIHWRTPLVESIKELEVRTVKLDVSTIAYSKDIQSVDVALTLNYHLVPETVNVLYRDIGGEYEARIINPAIQESVKAVSARYTAQELVELRAKVKDEIKNELSERLSKNFMQVDELSITDFAFSDQYELAIEAKQKAQQDALKAENDLKRVKFEADQRVAQATAEAEAIRIQAQAITQQGGEDYVNLKAIERWNGVLPVQMIPGSTVPFIQLSR